MKQKSIIILIILFLQILNQRAFSQEGMQLIDFETNLYGIENPNGGNIAFLVTRKGVLVVDAGATPNDGRKIVEIIRSVTKKPIKYLILTHLHGDHINGISGFPKDIQIIAHNDLEKNNSKFNEKNLDKYMNTILPNYLENLRIQLDSIQDKESQEYISLVNEYNLNVDYFEDIKTIKFRKPDITFTDFYRIKLGDERIILEYPGPGHTFDNIIVKFSLHNVIHVGDLVFNNMFPYTIEEHGVDIYNWVKVLDDLYKENIFTVIPGHGEIGEKIILKEQSDYFKNLAKKVERLKTKGLNLEQIIEQCDANDYNFIAHENQLSTNIKVLYDQLINTKIKWWNF